MEVVGAVDHSSSGGVERDPAIGAVPDIEHEVARSVVPVANEGTARGGFGVNGNGRNIDPVPFEPP